MRDQDILALGSSKKCELTPTMKDRAETYLKERLKEEAKGAYYSECYHVLRNGARVIAFVDYKFSFDGVEDAPMRDVCQVKRHGEYDICFGIRGKEYGSIVTFEKHKGTEKELFIKECIRLNVEWFSV